jgi:hypothetical protein
MKQKIFIIYLGGKHPKANIEVHDLVVTSGNCIQDCVNFCIHSWFANHDSILVKSNPHIDGYYQLELPKNYSSNGQYSLFCLNYGGYLPNQLAEMHEFIIVFAKDKNDAIKQSNKKLKLKFDLLHMDNCLQLDELINISDLLGLKFNEKTKDQVTISLHQEYISI